MPRNLPPAAALAAAFLAALAGPAAGGEPAGGDPGAAGGGASLFDGEGFDGWFFAPHTDPRAIAAMAPAERAAFLEEHAAEGREHWRVEPGDGGGAELVCDGEGPFLWTERDFADFELALEWKIAAGADSGVYVRGCPQVQIWDPADPNWLAKGVGNEFGSGGLWNNPETGPNGRGRNPSSLADNPTGEWNAMTVRVVGSSVTVDLNGTRVVNEATLENYWDRDLPLFPVGPIVLQTHGGETRWRNLRVREIARAMPESGFLAAAGAPLGGGWEPVGGATAEGGADAHAVFGPLGEAERATVSVGTRLGSPGTPVALLCEADGTVTPINPLEKVLKIFPRPGGPDGTWEPHPAPGVGFDVAAAEAAFDSAAENRVYVDATGGAVQLFLNGTTVFTALDSKDSAGDPVPLGVEGPGAAVRFVRDDIPRTPPGDEAGFAPVPLEPGLPGWSGDVDGYEAAGGVLTCRGGGNVYLPGPPGGSPDDWGDFALRFEFKLPPGGNNGVGLRCERGRDAAYHGMESQILDNTAAAFRDLAAYQYHGSIYGVAPALRGALAPVGHWNAEEIVCDGDRVTVTLNGVTIVDADVRELATAGPGGGTADGKPHPGLLNARGAVGFLGHGAPVAWRNVRIKPLPAGDAAAAATPGASE